PTLSLHDALPISLRKEVERDAKSQISKVRRETTQKVSAEAEENARQEIEKIEKSVESRVKRRVTAARREAEEEAERSFAERESALAAELEDAARALKSAEIHLREAEDRAQ